MDREINKTISATANKQHKNSERNELHFQKMGLLIIFTGVFGFLLWATFAPLDKGVTAPGTVIVAGNRKTIQSPGNGIVEKVMVQEGDDVEPGMTLIQLSYTQAQARYLQTRDKYLTALATYARLKAERDNFAAPVFPQELHDKEWQTQGEILIRLQQQLFQTRRQTLLTNISVNQHTLDGLQYQTQSLERSLTMKKSLALSLKQQLIDMKPLAQENFFPRNRFRELERQQDDMQSQLAELAGQIKSNKEKQKEIKEQIKQIEAEYAQDVNSQLAQTAGQLNEYRNNMQIARYDLDNTRIVSSTAGTVMDLSILTPGSVLSAGESLMEIVPKDTPLIIDAHISADLIDKVSPGLAVNMMFTALNKNKTPVIPGYVTLVSPDRLVDKNTGEPYYSIQLTVSDEGKKRLKNENIRPGMPVSVLIKTGSRSLLNYLFKPVVDRARIALTEE
jgi:protease secretion system membrane fusion protein